MRLRGLRDRLLGTPTISVDRRFAVPIERKYLSQNDLQEGKHGWMALRALVPSDHMFPQKSAYEKIKIGERFSSAKPIARFRDPMRDILRNENFMRRVDAAEHSQVNIRIQQGNEGQWYIPFELPQPIVDMIIAGLSDEASKNPDMQNFRCEITLRLPKRDSEFWKRDSRREPHLDFIFERRHSKYLSTPPTIVEYTGVCDQDSPPFSSKLKAKSTTAWTLYDADQKWLHGQPDLASWGLGRSLGSLFAHNADPTARRLLFRMDFIEGRNYGAGDIATNPDE